MIDFIPLDEISRFIRGAEDSTSLSLSQYVKRSIISSRAFVSQSVANEPMASDTLQVCQHMYAGWVLLALQMNEAVTQSETVRDRIGTVATERLYTSELDLIDHAFGKPGVEAMKPRGAQDDTGNLPIGRIIQVTFQGPRDNTVTVDMVVQIVPTIVPDMVANEFIAMNFSPSFSKRYLQWKAGEISFFKDFIMQLDLIHNKSKAYRNDKSGVLNDMQTRYDQSLNKALLKMSQIDPKKQNIANSILVFEATQFAKFCTDNGCNFKKKADRDKFFRKTMSMIVAVIDPMYDQVTVYVHGIDSPATYSSSQIKASGSKDQKFNLSEIMGYFSQGQTPKF